MRLTAYDPTYEVSRTVRLEIPPYIDAALLPDGDLILAAPVHTPERVGLPPHLLDREGHVIRSFGSDDPLYRSDVPFIDQRTIAPTEEGRAVWAAYRNQYVVERWGADGTKRGEIRRDVQWFPSALLPRRR